MKFLTTSETASILSKCVGVKSPLSIKPDLSSQNRRKDAALTKERWALVQSGVDRSEIKIKDFRLLVHNEVYARFHLGAVVREKEVAMGEQNPLSQADEHVSVGTLVVPPPDSVPDSFLSQAHS